MTYLSVNVLSEQLAKTPLFIIISLLETSVLFTYAPINPNFQTDIELLYAVALVGKFPKICA